MIFTFLFISFGRTETIDIYSSYLPKYEKLCTNFLLNATGLYYENKTEVSQFKLSTQGVHELKTKDGSSFFFNLVECNSFDWGMSTSNDNRFILSKNNKLRIWVDDASSFDQPSDNNQNNASKQITSMINSMGVQPSVTITDAMTHEVYQTINDFIFDEDNMWWEATINCSADFYYDIKFQDLIGFSSPTGQQPISDTNVYPPIPHIIQTQASDVEKPSLLGVKYCPCIPPLNAIIHNSQILISSSYFHNYSAIKDVNTATFVDFIDNSLIYIDNTGLNIQNFADSSQNFILNELTLTHVSSPNFCSFSSISKRDQPSSVIAWNANDLSQYVFINLTDHPTHHTKSLNQDEEIVSIASTLSSKSDFYLLIHNTKEKKFYLNKLNIHNEVVERIEISDILDTDKPSLYWSQYGYIFIIFGNTIRCSCESQILFNDLQFANEIEREGIVFNKILENTKGEFLITAEDGTIFFMTVDQPILSKIQIRFEFGKDDIIVSPEGEIFIILTPDGDYFSIPLESEKNILKIKSKFWSNTICPNSVEIDENIQEGNLLVDKSDKLTFSGSVFSKNPQKFIIHVSDNFYVNTTSHYEEIVQLQPQQTNFIPLQKHNFNITLTPKKLGNGKFVIHTSSPSWICGNEIISRSFIIGCPSQKELRVRGGSKIKQFYTNTYVRPIIDVYNYGYFVEEFKGNLTVFCNKKIGFVDENNNVLNGTNDNKIILYKFDQEYELTLLSDDSWSYCNLSVKAYVTIVSPKHPYYYYSVVGLAVYCFLMLIYASIVWYQWRKQKKEIT